MPRDFAHKPRQPEGSHIPRWVWYFTSIAAVGFAAFLFFLSQVPPESGGADMVRIQLDKALSESQAAATQQTTQPSEERETIADIKDKADALKQAFEFYELLENDEVAIDLPGDDPTANGSTGGSSGAGAAPSSQAEKNVTQTASSTSSATPKPVSGSKWIIQVASFANVADADQVRAQLILNGLPEAHIESVEVSGKGTFHRVMVGPYTHRPSLNKAQDILADLRYQPLVKTL